MRRNLCSTECYFCGDEPKLVEKPRLITQRDAGRFFDEYAGMLVADAECPSCRAQYLAWVDMRGCKYRTVDPYIHGDPYFDLSFRKTFNDEPACGDQPPWYWWEERERKLHDALAVALDYISPFEARRVGLEKYRRNQDER